MTILVFSNCKIKTEKYCPPVNIEKLIKFPDQPTDDLRIDNFQSPSNKTAELPSENIPQSQASHPDIATLAFHFASVLKNYPSHSTYSSEACKQVYKTTLLQENYSPVMENYEDWFQIVLIYSWKVQLMEGTYTLHLDVKLFNELTSGE